MTAPIWLIPGSANNLFYGTGASIAGATVGAGLTLSNGVLKSAAGSMMSFGSVLEAQGSVIQDNITTVQVAGYNFTGDGGDGYYTRVNSLPTPYYKAGGPLPPAAGNQQDSIDIVTVPPSFQSGIPTLCYGTTWYGNQQGNGGPFTQPIHAGNLAIVVVFLGSWAAPPSSVTDSVGNTYALAAGAGGSTTNAIPTAIYYNSNPKFAPIGTFINVSALPTNTVVYVYSVPGFTGAVVDQTAVQVTDNAIGTGGISLTTSAGLSTNPEFVLGVVSLNQNPIGSVTTYQYTLQPGWYDICPQIVGRNVISCYVANSNSPVTFNPTWTFNNPPNMAFIVTFKTFNNSYLNPSNWLLQPKWPIHSSHIGISPGTTDNKLILQNFARYLSTIAPPSGTSVGAAGTAAWTVTFDIPSSTITIIPPYSLNGNPYPQWHQMAAGLAISFDTTGKLPDPIVRGKKYFVHLGTVGPKTIQISDTDIFRGGKNNDGGSTNVKGTPIIFSGTQSGTHSFTTYSESWTEIVFDPGLYYASVNQFIIGYGLKKMRIKGYGARWMTAMMPYTVPWLDPNSSEPNGAAWQGRFKAVPTGGGYMPNAIQLQTPSDISNYRVNSWVMLMQNELMDGVYGNWNQNTFEYKKIQTIDNDSGSSTYGQISFFEAIQYTYQDTLPKFQAYQGGDPSGWSIGAPNVVQLNENFMIQAEIHGIVFEGPTQDSYTGLYSLRMIDCEFYCWGYKTGPTPSTIREMVFRNCTFHNGVSEVDKMIDYLEYSGCTFDRTSNLDIQSATVNWMVIDKCRMIGLLGTPKNLVIRDTRFLNALELGASFGVTERMVLINSHIPQFTSARMQQQMFNINVPGITFVGGTIQMDPSFVLFGNNVTDSNGKWIRNPFWWAIPGARVVILADVVTSGGGYYMGVGGGNDFLGILKTFIVEDVYIDSATNKFCVDTDLDYLSHTSVQATGTISGGVLNVTAISPSDACIMKQQTVSGGTLPATGSNTISADLGVPNQTNNLGNYSIANSQSIAIPDNSTPTMYTIGTVMMFNPHPCPNMTVIGCTGGRFVSDQGGAPPNIPFMSYFSRTYTGTNYATYVASGAYNVSLIGDLKYWIIDVVKAYTGSGTTCVMEIFMYGWKDGGNGNMYPTWIKQTINLKVKGVRKITQFGVTWNDTTTAISGDSLSPVTFWLGGGHATDMLINGDGFNTPAGDTLSMMPKTIMTAQTTQNVDTGSVVISKTQYGKGMAAEQFGGFNLYADTIVGSQL
jgi:hypothetical protein